MPCLAVFTLKSVVISHWKWGFNHARVKVPLKPLTYCSSGRHACRFGPLMLRSKLPTGFIIISFLPGNMGQQAYFKGRFISTDIECWFGRAQWNLRLLFFFFSFSRQPILLPRKKKVKWKKKQLGRRSNGIPFDAHRLYSSGMSMCQKGWTCLSNSRLQKQLTKHAAGRAWKKVPSLMEMCAFIHPRKPRGRQESDFLLSCK